MPSLLNIVLGAGLAATLATVVLDEALDERDRILGQWATAYLRDAVLATVAAHGTACRGAAEHGTYATVSAWDWDDIKASGWVLPGSRMESLLVGDDPAVPMVRSATLDDGSGLVTVELEADHEDERLLLTRMAATGGWESSKNITATGLEISFSIAPEGGRLYAGDGPFGTGMRQMDAPAHVSGPLCSGHPTDDLVSRDYLLDSGSGGNWSHPWK